MSMNETAQAFFEACEAGKGWESCKDYCHADATFACQADALADVKSIASYADWMKGLMVPIPDGRYEIKSWGVDETRRNVTAAAVFHGTQTGQGGPVAPTGKTLAADYVYVMNFDGSKIRHMTKIWNDGYSLRQLGWA